MKTTVQDVMTTAVVTTRPNTPFCELVSTMHQHDVSAVPVVDDNGRLVGIVSEADLLLKEDLGSAPVEHLLERRSHRTDCRKAAGRVAAELMTAPVITIVSTASLADAAGMLHTEHVKRLPVVDDGDLVGIVSRSNLLSAFRRTDQEISIQVNDEILRRQMSIPHCDVEAAVHRGVVTLAGCVERRALADAIVREVRGVDGVVAVDSFLRWIEDDQPRPAESFVRV